MVWHQTGNKPLTEPMMASLLTHKYITWSQWVNTIKNPVWNHTSFPACCTILNHIPYMNYIIKIHLGCLNLYWFQTCQHSFLHNLWKPRITLVKLLVTKLSKVSRAVKLVILKDHQNLFISFSLGLRLLTETESNFMHLRYYLVKYIESHCETWWFHWQLSHECIYIK